MRVFWDTRARHFAQNPYIGLLQSALPDEIEVVAFSWRRALCGRYDLVHVHWPEYLLRPRGTPRSRVAQALMLIWIFRMWITRKPVIRTVHDREPWIRLSGSEHLLLRMLKYLYKGRIWLTPPELSSDLPAADDVVIPHADYTIWTKSISTLEPKGTQAADPSDHQLTLLCFGVLRPYKRFEDVIRAVLELDSTDPEIVLHIVGGAPDPAYAEMLMALAGQSSRVAVSATRASDAQLATELARCSLVVVPYESLYNSGVVLLALSANRPVALRSNAISRSLEQEFGSQWIRLWDGDLSGHKLLDMTDVRAQGTVRFSVERSWRTSAERHAAYYNYVLRRSASSPDVSN